MFGKISLRNIPMHVFQALEFMANRHDRSTEAEARQAIHAWVEPMLVKEERSARRQEVAERLSRLLQLVNADLYGDKLRPSHVAQEIKEERATEVEDWFLGNIEPTFAQLEAIANAFGINVKWLQHGDGNIYPVQNHRLSEDPEQAVQWLGTWDTDNPEGDAVKILHLIRSTSEQGELYIVKESIRGHFRVYYTPTHVSEKIGTGGEAQLKYLFVTLELLYKRWSKVRVKYQVIGHLLDPTDVTLLTRGQTNPGALLKDHGVSMWWEDIWHREMIEKHNYWPGWRSLCDRIERVVQSSGHLAELREKIRSGALL